jgi:hypothetical protein
MSALRVGFLKAFASSGRLLDVGYGTGSFLRCAGRAGFDPYGSDIHGLDFGVNEVSLTGEERWDVVTFFDSLEHFSDFSDILSVANRSRLIVVSLPFTPDDLMTSRDWKHFKPGEHLHYFSINSLSRLFSGFYLVAVSDVEDAIRGQDRGNQNILSAVFRNKEA